MELCVLLDEFKNIKGTFKVENELCELIDFYILELTKDIQAKNTLDEQLVNQFETLGKLSKFYNRPISNEYEISNFIKNYNEIAPVKLSYKTIKIDDEVKEQK
ncbi:hypothetical protein M4L39_14460 [Staphylococcus equorum]|uniref:hypothetical protein n=1 Tax=Staphylococcus equorum TaxID=246432 RepID=UPI0024078081|nr:hypothetical protein [Staphylococcus equorum]MDG0844608.1 hypothetical protein [Staphylococcus equorum]